MNRPAAKAGRNDPCPCGSGKKYKNCCLPKEQAAPAADPQALLQMAIAHHQAGRLSEAESGYREVLQQRPSDPDALHLLGLVAHQVGQHQGAVDLITRALQIKPRYAGAHNSIGTALAALGRHDEAVDHYRAALGVEPDFEEAHVNLGIALRSLGRVDEAQASLVRAVALNPRSTAGHFNLGLLLHGQGRVNEAIPAYERALQASPAHAPVLNNLGVALADTGRWDAAIERYRQAIGLQPAYADAHNNLGLALAEKGRLQEALQSYERAIQARPDFAEAFSNLGVLLQEVGNVEQAQQCYRRAHELGSPGAIYRWALMLPAIMGTRDEVLASRELYAKNIADLLRSPPPLADPLHDVGATNFFLAYHGLNDRDLQAQVAQLYEAACPGLAFTAAHCSQPRRPGPVRIGFLSKFIYNHSVSRCFSKTVRELAKTGQFEVVLLSSTDAQQAQVEAAYEGFDGQRVHLPLNLEGSRQAIAALSLDVLMYMDIGMDPQSYFLAFARLARVQGVMGGHPVTTGIRNVDWFLTTDAMEPPGAEAHYTEQLAHFPFGVSYFERPPVPARLKTRAELGLPEDRHLYLCPMKLQKMHPDFDAAMSCILQLDPQGLIVLFADDRHETWAPRLAQRLDRTTDPAVRERVVFHPWISDYGDFISANAVADVVLDPFHFGIGSTLVATFSVGTPIVTWPGHFLRGRGGAGFCRMLGVDECIVDDQAAYPERAVQFATDAALRDCVRTKIAAASHRFYDNPQPIQDFVRWLTELPLP
jgi:predicted O-linked N-acetylglucosamine transferase (SPINDLY family)